MPSEDTYAAVQPSFVLPTAVALDDSVSRGSASQPGLEDLQYFIGQDAVDRTLTHSVYFPVRQGVVSPPALDLAT